MRKRGIRTACKFLVVGVQWPLGKEHPGEGGSNPPSLGLAISKLRCQSDIQAGKVK